MCIFIRKTHKMCIKKTGKIFKNEQNRNNPVTSEFENGTSDLMLFFNKKRLNKWFH